MVPGGGTPMPATGVEMGTGKAPVRPWTTAAEGCGGTGVPEAGADLDVDMVVWKTKSTVAAGGAQG